jgi:hypothetical protein
MCWLLLAAGAAAAGSWEVAAARGDIDRNLGDQ